MSEAGAATFNSTVIAPTMTLSRSSSNSPNVEPVLLFDNTDTVIGAGENIGSIRFTTSNEDSGTDALLESGRIACFSESGHGSATNASALAFYTASSEAASERMRIDSSGKVGIGITPLASTTGNGLGAAFSTLAIKASDTVTQALSIDATNAAGPNFMISSYSDGSGSYYMLGANLLLDTSGNTSWETNGENMSGIILDSRAGNGIQFITAAHDGSSYVPAERMRIDNSGNVGIGATTPTSYDGEADNLVVASSGHTGITIASTGSNQRTNLYFSDGTSGTEKYIGGFTYDHNDNSLLTRTGGAERIRILSGGEVLVGQTSNGVTSTGIGLVSDGVSHMYSGGTHCLMLGRGASNGDVLKFNKSGTTSGSIGVANTDEIYIYAEAGKGILVNNNGLLAGTSSGGGSDDTTDLGQADVRWDDVYATNGTIQTSDENEKQDIASMTTAELAVGKRLSALFKTFRWKSKVTEKADKARTHSGIIAQQVKAAFEAESLDATKYALFCSNTWTDDDGKEQTRMGIRYPELLSFIASYNESRFTAIEARLTALEGS